LNVTGFQDCPSCGTDLDLTVFPALHRPVERGAEGETLMVEGESSCFYHPAKKAVIPCGACGRFLCALCDVELDGSHLCPTCLESGKRKGRLAQLENRRTNYDSLALTIALVPLIMWPITLITAPCAIYYAIRYWNAPRSIVPRGRLRYVLAILFAALQIIGWGFLIYNIVTE
jgi:hypothetical protein